MRLQVVKRRTKAIGEFNDREWKAENLVHYGSPKDFSETILRIVAREGRAIIGSLRLSLKRGVCHIHSVIVGQEQRCRGVGSALMQAAERIAREQGAHKLWLETGDGWKAAHFYQKLGFRKNTILPRHYSEQNFALYEKLL